jgi:hypothetical protein
MHCTYKINGQPKNAVNAHINSQPLRELTSLVAAQRVAGVGDEECRHLEIAMLVRQQLKRFSGRRQQLLPSDDHTVDVEEKPETPSG